MNIERYLIANKLKFFLICYLLVQDRQARLAVGGSSKKNIAAGYYYREKCQTTELPSTTTVSYNILYPNIDNLLKNLKSFFHYNLLMFSAFFRNKLELFTGGNMSSSFTKPLK